VSASLPPPPAARPPSRIATSLFSPACWKVPEKLGSEVDFIYVFV
jgi:hypothetical protein